MMSPSAHARFRDRLTVLSEAREPLRAVAEAGERRGWWDDGLAWERTFGRFDPGEQPYATMVFETSSERQHISRVEAFAARPDEAGGSQSLTRSRTLGWLRVSRFPFDPGLPTLRDVASQDAAAVVRYQPSRRCTLRVATTAGTRFVKVFPDGRAARIHADGLRLWDAARRGRLGFAVALPDRCEPSTRSVWQSPVAGQKEAFVEGYEEVAGRLDGVVLRAYRSHKRLAKALRTARALRPDGDARAQRHLASAVDCLEERR